MQQLGDVVAATGANTLPIEQLAGALLSAVDSKDPAAKEGWRKRGAAFFQSSRRGWGRHSPGHGGAQASDDGASPTERQDRA